jgi:hypothetical protein
MEKTQLELLKKENSELKKKLELLNLKLSSKLIHEEIKDLTDGDYSTEVEWDCPLSFYVSYREKDENTLYFDIESSNDYIKFHNDTIEISYDDIIKNLDEKPINGITISESINELINDCITEW